MLSRLRVSISPEEVVDDVSISSERVIRVTGTISCSSGVVILSRPASSLGSHRMRRLFHVVSGLERENYNVVCVSRGVRRVLHVSSSVAMVHSKGRVTARPTDRVSVSGVVGLVMKQRLARHFPPGAGGINGIVLQISKLDTQCTGMESISFRIQRNRVVKITKLNNSKEARLLRDVFNVQTGGTKGVALNNGAMNGQAPHRSVTDNFTVLARRQQTSNVFKVLSVASGAIVSDLGGCGVNNLFLDESGVGASASGYVSSVEMGAPGERAGVEALSKKGRRGMVLKE